MRVLLFLSRVLLLALVGHISISDKALAQIVEAPPSSHFVEEVERIHSVLPSAWQENILGQIRLMYPADPRTDKLSRFGAVISRNLCNLQTGLASNPPAIRVSHVAMLLDLSVDQAIVLHLLGQPEFSNPDKIVEYARSEVRRVSEILRREAKTETADCANVRIDFRSPLGFFGFSPAEYDSLMAHYNREPTFRALGDIVGGASVFFATLHEAGHVWIDDYDSEAAADRFAVEVMNEGEVPPSLGVSALLVLAEAVKIERTRAPEKIDEADCRLLQLAKQDRALSNPSAATSLGVFHARAEALRQFWLKTYKDACG
jgi:hypothetical protein